MNHQVPHHQQQQNQQHQPLPAVPGSYSVANIHNTGMMPIPRKHQQQNHSMNNGFPPHAAGLVTSISSSLVSNSNPVSYAQPPHQQAQFHSAAASALNLPPGVFVPQSIDQNLILASPKAMELLHSLSPKQMQDSLMEFDEAMRSKAGKVRNITAYLIGVFKRYVNVNSKQRKSGAPVMTEGLTPIVRVTIQKMVDSGFCTKAEVSDPKVEQKLKMLSEHDAVLAIDELSSVPRDTIRNFPSYFSGILNRYQRGQTGNGGGNSGGGNGNGNSGGGGSRLDDKRGGRSRHDDRPSDRDRDRHRDSPSRDSHDDDRRRYRSRRNRSHSDDYSRSPSPDRNYRRRSRRERSRSRSRDRFDGDGGGGGRRGRRSHRSRSPSPGRHGDRNSHSNSLGGHHYDPQGVPMGNAPVPIQGGHMMNQPPPMMYGGAPPTGGVVPMGFPPPPPPPPTRQTMQMHQQYQQQLQPPSAVQTHQPWQHQQMQQQQMPYSYPPGPTAAAAAAAAAAPPSNPALAPALFHHTNPTSQITGPSTLDILGLAEKAALALSGFTSLTPAPATRVDPRQTAVVQTHHVPIQTTHVQNHHVPAHTNHAQNHHVPAHTNHVQNHHVPAHTNHVQNHHVTVQRDPRRVNNANPSNPASQQTNEDENIHITIQDLSPMIQYSLQNLKSSGFLDQELGQNGKRWLKKLPEPIALQALERFSSCDVSTMRSKEGYLCGLLKRAVDKRGL